MKLLRAFFLLGCIGVISLAQASSSGSSSGSTTDLNTNILLKVYPNPADGVIYVEWDGSETKASVHVFDALGSEVSGINIKEENDHLLRLDASNLSAGVYFVTVKIGTFARTERIVIR